jgi:hypothetical protein
LTSAGWQGYKEKMMGKLVDVLGAVFFGAVISIMWCQHSDDREPEIPASTARQL